MKKIGTVEVLKTRVYPLDPAAHGPIVTEVCVEPGVYPLYTYGITHFWMMTGKINGNTIRRGDGLFLLAEGDNPLDIEVTFPSYFFGPDEFRDFRHKDLTTREGHHEQRLRITIEED